MIRVSSRRTPSRSASSCSATTYGPRPSSSWSAFSPTHRMGCKPVLLGHWSLRRTMASFSPEEDAALVLADEHVLAQALEHARRDFAGIGAAGFGVHVLGAERDALTGEERGDVGEPREGRGDDDDSTVVDGGAPRWGRHQGARQGSTLPRASCSSSSCRRPAVRSSHAAMTRSRSARSARRLRALLRSLRRPAVVPARSPSPAPGRSASCAAALFCARRRPGPARARAAPT